MSDNLLSGQIPFELCNQGDTTPDLENNQLCPPYPDCGEGLITFEEEQDISECLECPDSIEGDINYDGYVNIYDIIHLVNCILSDSCDTCYDINYDETTDVTDIILLVNIILEWQIKD